ncbi:hypothetical protein WIT60_00610 [Aquabacterium sp. G14]|uniref:hypothetical protein n=1 Tax=Aquabacterium sp. G14 TaxID=3130164 RepID=UPI0030A93D4D
MTQSHVFSLLMVGVSLWTSSAAAQTASPLAGWGGYVEASVEAWSNGTPVLDLDGRWAKGYERRAGEQRAYVTARAEAGVLLPWGRQRDGRAWRLGAVGRVDGSARMSGDAAQALYHYQSRTDPDAPVTLDARSHILYWTGQGVTVQAPVMDLGGFKLDVSFDQLTLKRLRSLRSAGQVAYNANDTYSYAGTLRDDHSKTLPTYFQPPGAEGVGQALSLALAWRKASRSTLVSPWVPDTVSLQVSDAWSRLRWRGINGEDAVLNSEVADPREAQINGTYSRRTVVERIPVTTQVRAEWLRPEGLWSVKVKNRVGLWQGWLGWQNPGTVGWRVAVEPFAAAMQLGVDWKGLSASVMTDRLDNGSHARGGQLSWSGSF